MSKLPGRNKSERTGSLENLVNWWPSLYKLGEGSTSLRKVNDTRKMHRRGISDDTVTKDMGSNWRNPPHRGKKSSASKVGSITVDAGNELKVRGNRTGSY
jgi:hypothetical protein